MTGQTGQKPERDRSAYERDLTAPPPPWFAEIYPGGDGRGWMEKRERHAMVFAERDARTLVVAFDNIGPVNDLSFKREPWAWKFVHDRGHSYLGVMARRKVWYRDPEIIGWMEDLSARGVFSRYERVVLCGTSMGAFAALAFAPLAPGCVSIAFNPQATLDPALVPWEERWRSGRMADWSLPYSDAGAGARAASRAFVVYDPFFDGDRRHAERIQGPDVVKLKCWFGNHFTPVFLKKLGLLKPIMEGAIDGTLTADGWYRMARARRTLPWYAKGLTAAAEERGHPQLAARVSPVFRAMRMAAKAREKREAQPA